MKQMDRSRRRSTGGTRSIRIGLGVASMLACAVAASAQQSPAVDRGILALASTVSVPSVTVVLLDTAVVHAGGPQAPISVPRSASAERWSTLGKRRDAAWMGLGGATLLVGVLGFFRHFD